MPVVTDGCMLSYGETELTPVIARLFLGAYKDALLLPIRNPHNIETVINLTPANDLLPAGKFNYIQIPIQDGHPIPIDALDRALAGIWRHIRDGNVLVHCMAGISRSPSVVAAYLHRCGFLNFDDALDYLKKARPIVVPHFAITNSIKQHMGIFPYNKDFGRNLQ